MTASVVAYTPRMSHPADDAVFDLIDGVFALMAIPTMTATLLLSPHVMRAARDYFRRLKAGEFPKR